MSAGLRGRIAERISHSVRVKASFVRGSLAGLAVVFLASVTVIVAVRGPVVGPAPPAASSVQESGRQSRPYSSATAGEAGEPTPLLTLRRLAAAETLEGIDAILDQCAPRWLVFTQMDREVFVAPDF
jgi:hypothetical protein